MKINKQEVDHGFGEHFGAHPKKPWKPENEMVQEEQKTYRVEENEKGTESDESFTMHPTPQRRSRRLQPRRARPGYHD